MKEPHESKPSLAHRILENVVPVLFVMGLAWVGGKLSEYHSDAQTLREDLDMQTLRMQQLESEILQLQAANQLLQQDMVTVKTGIAGVSTRAISIEHQQSMILEKLIGASE